MSRITANELKTRGISAIEASLAEGRTEAVVSVRGADRYVVMEVAHYRHLRECELEAALAESRAEIAAGRFVKESPAAHVARLQAMNSVDAIADAGAKAGTAVASTARAKRRPLSGAAPKAPRRRVG